MKSVFGNTLKWSFISSNTVNHTSFPQGYISTELLITCCQNSGLIKTNQLITAFNYYKTPYSIICLQNHIMPQVNSYARRYNLLKKS